MKHSNESDAGRARAQSFMNGDKMEAEPRTTRGAQKVDPSVTLGPLEGEQRGSVDMAVTMAKPQAYVAKKGSP